MKRISVLLIALLLSVPVFGACTSSEQNPADITTTNKAEVSTTAQITDDSGNVTVSEDPGFESVDLDNYTFKILTHELKQFDAESTDSGVLESAIFTRNVRVEEKFKINIDYIEVDHTKYKQKVMTAIDAGVIVYDMLTPGISYACQLACEGYLIELHNIPNLHFDSSYWWNNVLEDSSVGGMNYFAVSDLNSVSFEQMSLVMFNKDIAADHRFESLYDMVKDGRWTIDTFIDYSGIVYEDTNGNQQVDENDTFGLTGNSYMTDCFVYGIDMLFVPKDNDDIPYMNFLGNQEFYSFFDKILGLFDAQSTLYGEDYNAKIASGRLVVPQAAFAEGRSLFWVDSIGWVPTLRTTDIDFGMLPMPKLNEAQADYSNSLHAWASSSCAVLVSCEENLDNIGMIIDYMAYLSKLLVRPAYYDIFLQGQMMKDVESTEMLPLIIDNCRIDIAMVYRVPGFTFIDDLRSLTKGSSMSLSTILTRSQNTYQNSLDKITASLSENY